MSKLQEERCFIFCALCAKPMANYKCCLFYEWNLICLGRQWAHSLFMSSRAGDRSIRRAHQKPQELDSKALPCRLDEQTKSHWGTFGTGTVGYQALWCWTLALCGLLKDAGLAFNVEHQLARHHQLTHGQFSDVGDCHFSFGLHSWFGRNLQRI